MNIFLAYYSRTGHTESLALCLAKELQRRGHDITIEKIEVKQPRSKWRLALPLLTTLPVLPLYLWSTRFRRWWLQRYRQAEQAIQPLAHPDVTRFDCVCIGGPKWLYLAFPLARYLQQIRGIGGKPVGAFATFCGPPLKIFELEMLFTPLRQRVENHGGLLQATLAISSGFHEFFFFHEMEYVFRLVSHLCFHRPLSSYMLDSPWGKQEVNKFCDRLCQLASRDATDAPRKENDQCKA